MRCPRCGNTDKSYFYLGSKGYYCRKCIKFKRILLNEELYPKEYPIKEESFHYDLKYALTPKQKIISDECASLIDQSDVILHCVCGSGKTEIVLKTISEYLKIDLDHHEAGSDAYACLMIVLSSMMEANVYDVKELLNKLHLKIKYNT